MANDLGSFTGMTAFSLGTIWEETIIFLRRESGVLIPIALAIFGPAQLLLQLGMAGADPSRGVASAPALLVLPAALMVLFGNLVLSRVVLIPGISVGEALRDGLHCLPRSLGAILLMVAALIAAASAIVIAATVGIMIFQGNPRSPAIASQLVLLMAIPAFVLAIRMLLLVPILAMEDGGAIDAIRRAWTLGKNNVLRLAGIFILAMFLGMTTSLIEQFVIGSLIGLLKLAVGAAELLDTIHILINAAIEAMLSLAFAVYLALVYRTLARS